MCKKKLCSYRRKQLVRISFKNSYPFFYVFYSFVIESKYDSGQNLKTILRSILKSSTKNFSNFVQFQKCVYN